MADNVNKKVEEFNEELGKISERIVSLGGSLGTNLVGNLQDAVNSARKLSDPLKDAASITAEINKLADKNETLIIKRRVAEEEYVKALKKGKQADIDKKEALLKQYSAQLQIQQKLEDQLRILAQTSEEYNKQNSLGNKLKGIFDKNLGSVKDQVTQFFTLSGIIGIIVNKVGEIDKQLIETSKSLGISKDASMEMRKEMESYSLASGNAFVTVGRLHKAQQGLSEQLGIAVNFSNKERENFARLTELVGLTSDEAGKLAANSTLVGKSTENYVADLRNGAFEAQRANKIRISDKELLSTIGKLSSGILVKFQGNTKALAAAVVQAKALGVTLEQVDKIGESMLNFEQSIEKELEAELITGKQLNFERARAAALTGDQATLMEEIKSQAGSLADFQSMNVVAQKSLAEAFGMSREEMADMLRKQEVINKYGDEASKLNEEQIKEMEKKGMNAAQYTKHLQDQQDIQAQFNDLITKLQEQLASLVDGPLISFLSTLLKILNSTTGISMIFGAMIGSQLPGVIKAVQMVAKFTKTAAKFSIAEAVAKAASSAASIPGVGWLLAGAAAAGIAALLGGYLSKADDMVSPGYGKRTLMAPEGAIALNDKDTVIAGTNLGGGGNKGGGGGGESMSAVVAAIRELQNSVNKLASRPITVNMDGEKVGTMVGRRNETGTEQVKNSYSLA